MKAVLELAKECGAEDCFGNDIPECENAYTFFESDLVKFAAALRQARVLTEDELRAATPGYVFHDRFGRAAAIQRKFCEINGIQLRGQSGETDAGNVR